ncbi:hypothetical protein CL656_03820 [bacterium]|nr:hypothetical protein [bacterium]|tara:strand:+ start:10133 stop:12712 length:2580 start_codon:yes stop_codon:yes gene_type:complete
MKKILISLLIGTVSIINVYATNHESDSKAEIQINYNKDNLISGYDLFKKEFEKKYLLDNFLYKDKNGIKLHLDLLNNNYIIETKSKNKPAYFLKDNQINIEKPCIYGECFYKSEKLIDGYQIYFTNDYLYGISKIENNIFDKKPEFLFNQFLKLDFENKDSIYNMNIKEGKNSIKLNTSLSSKNEKKFDEIKYKSYKFKNLINKNTIFFHENTENYLEAKKIIKSTKQNLIQDICKKIKFDYDCKILNINILENLENDLFLEKFYSKSSAIETQAFKNQLITRIRINDLSQEAKSELKKLFESYIQNFQYTTINHDYEEDGKILKNPDDTTFVVKENFLTIHLNILYKLFENLKGDDNKFINSIEYSRMKDRNLSLTRDIIENPETAINIYYNERSPQNLEVTIRQVTDDNQENVTEIEKFKSFIDRNIDEEIINRKISHNLSGLSYSYFSFEGFQDILSKFKRKQKCDPFRFRFMCLLINKNIKFKNNVSIDENKITDQTEILITPEEFKYQLIFNLFDKRPIKWLPTVETNLNKNDWFYNSAKYAIDNINLRYVFNYSNKHLTKFEKEYQNFSQCLTDKNAIYYGMKNDSQIYEDNGKITTQRDILGYAKNMPHVDCKDFDNLSSECKDKDFKRYPTWIINNKAYDGIKFPDELNKLTGCKLNVTEKEIEEVDNKINFNDKIRRKEFIGLIIETLNKDYSSRTLGKNFKKFDDLKYYLDIGYNYIYTAKNLGIIKGDSKNNTVRPNDYLSRAEAIVILNRAFPYFNNVDVNNFKLKFKDIDQDTWYSESLKRAVKSGIIKGTSPSTFSPGNQITIAESLTILDRIINRPKFMKTNVVEFKKFFSNEISCYLKLKECN